VRRRGARAAWIAFILAGGGFEALLLGALVLLGKPIDAFLLLQPAALAGAYVVASAAAVVIVYVVRARNAADEARAHAWTEPVDLDTLRERIHPEGLPEPERSKVRRLLDENHAAAQGAPARGIAGGARRR
jgi:hypothetical protein